MTRFSKMIVFLILFYPSVIFGQDIVVRFSPEGGCTDLIVEKINNSKRSIFVQAYSFTSQSISDALINAFERDVKVKIILDKSQLEGKSSKYQEVKEAGIPTLIDSKHAIAHNKIIIIDENIILTGSFNFTNNAESRNAENLLCITNPNLANLYISNWWKHQQHSK